MVAEPELPATTAQSQVAASGFPDRKENRNAAQTVIDAGEWRIREWPSQKIEKYTTCLHRATKVLKTNTTHLETNVCGKSPGNDACRRLSTPIMGVLKTDGRILHIPLNAQDIVLARDVSSKVNTNWVLSRV